jgi:hypothetical protein
MAALTPDPSIPARQGEVENALASVRLEGLEPSAEALSVFERYANGEISLEEMGAAIDAAAERDYGPVRLSRDERP